LRYICVIIANMKIRNIELLEKFTNKHADSKKAIQAFVDFVEDAEWKHFNDVKFDFNSVDYIADERYIFNIRGNKYRIIAVIVFVAGLFVIRFVGTHAEYSKINAKSIQQK
jgi:mRNA interferase HigB